MAENKKENKISNKNKKAKVISIILILLLIILVVVSLAYSQNIKLANSSNEEQEVEESKTQEIVLEDNKYMHVETDASGDQVPVPNGFVGSKVTGENEIDSGYVIYAINEGETEDTVEINDTNKDEAQKTRNQYVWVPVPDISKFYGTDANGKKWGKIYNFTTGTSSDSTFDGVTGTYALNWSETNGIMRISYGTSNREPDVLSGRDTPYYLKTYGVSEGSMHDFLIRQEIDFSKMINSVETKEKFWDMFVIDSLIGNTDRHNGNWGFLLNKKTHKVVFSPIYDCGSCLNPMLEDTEIEKFTETELKNLAINCYSCLKENGKKINYMTYIKQMKNEECNNAIKRLFNNINLTEIKKFIDNIECMSEVRKEFYKKIIEQRYNVIKEVPKGTGQNGNE